MLQQAWFRVKEIPSDQRSIRTLAKVGGLVGKVMEIDEETRFRLDFVRMKIACRDVSKVPDLLKAPLEFTSRILSLRGNKQKTVSVTASAPPKYNTQGQDNRMKTTVEHSKKNVVSVT